MIYRFVALILTFSLWSCSTNDSVSSGTEIGNGYLSAVVITANGEPVVNAKVTLLTNKDIPESLDTLRTKSLGDFSFISDFDTIINLLVQLDSLSLFVDSFELSTDPNSIDTFIVKSSGNLSLVVKDSSKYIDEKFYIRGTGIYKTAYDLVKDGEHWILNFDNVPELNRGQILLSANDSVESFSGTFNITSGSTEKFVEGVSWEEYSLPSINLVSLAGWERRLWYCSSDSILEIEDGTFTNSYASDSNFTFGNLTATTIGEDGTFWLANDKGFIGYITQSGYHAMIPTPSCTTSIISVTRYWCVDKGNGIAQNDTAYGKYYYTEAKFTQIISDYSSGVWAATDGGDIYHIIDSSKATVLTTVDGLPGDSILDIASASNGELWVVTLSSILKISNSNIVEVPSMLGETLTDIRFVEVNKEGVWFASENTLYVLIDNTVYPINWDGVSFNGSQLVDIYSHVTGSFWLVSDNGLFEF